jgi:hypothetical protein
VLGADRRFGLALGVMGVVAIGEVGHDSLVAVGGGKVRDIGERETEVWREWDRP